ncbi:MAG: DUF4389 domain-containing protein [Actinobacteria bacterium]|nr:DUF4389 domain-containing protein [Actinomycetota bacterium]
MSQQITTQIDLQLKDRNRTTALFRLILVAPVAIFVMSFSETSMWSENSDYTTFAGIFVLPVILTLLVRGVYPSYVLTFNKAMLNLSLRVGSYIFLLNDQYPSIEADEKTFVEFPEIEGGKKLSRGMPLIKWLLAIPLYIFGIVYSIYALLLTLVAWITIIFTGEYPEWCAAGVIGTISFWNRVFGYAFVLVTDEYPSFSL